MTLDLNNLNSKDPDKFWDPASLWEDISVMDNDQLDRYVQMVFSDHMSLDFLPEQFWNGHYFAVWGGSEYGSDGRSADQPGNFLGGIYRLTPKMLTREFTRHDGSKIEVDPKYQDRLGNVLTGIMEESIGETPKQNTSIQDMLAYFSVQTVNAGLFRNEYLCAVTDFADNPHKRRNTDQEQLNIEDGPALTVPKLRLFNLALNVVNHPRYENLDFNYTRYGAIGGVGTKG